jgi:hypothetical protein
MNICFAAFDMVVQIIAEQVDQINGIIPNVLVGVAWE